MDGLGRAAFGQPAVGETCSFGKRAELVGVNLIVSVSNYDNDTYDGPMGRLPRTSIACRALQGLSAGRAGKEAVPLKAVIDTCVLVSALRSRHGASYRLLSLVGDPRWQSVMSPALMFQYEAVLKRQAADLWADQETVEAVLNYFCRVAERPEIAYVWRPAVPDPNDEMVLELAAAGGGACIVTHNVADFRGENRFGLAILTPKQFLDELENLP